MPRSPTRPQSIGSTATGNSLRILISAEETGGTMSMVETLVKPGSGPTYHSHAREDETFYVVFGTAEVWIDREIFRCEAGDRVFGPRNVFHTYRNVGNTDLKMILARLIHQRDGRCYGLTTGCVTDAAAGCWVNRVLVRQMCQALQVARVWGERGTGPDGYGGRQQRALARLRNRAASGHAAAKAMRIRLVVSLIRAASLSSRRRMVANSALASG